MASFLSFFWLPPLSAGSIRSCRFRHGLRGFGGVASHSYARADDGADRRIWPADARLWGLEASAFFDVAEVCPIRHRRLSVFRSEQYC